MQWNYDKPEPETISTTKKEIRQKGYTIFIGCENKKQYHIEISDENISALDKINEVYQQLNNKYNINPAMDRDAIITFVDIPRTTAYDNLMKCMDLKLEVNTGKRGRPRVLFAKKQ